MKERLEHEIEELKLSIKNMKEYYEKTITELKIMYEAKINDLEEQLKKLRKEFDEFIAKY